MVCADCPNATKEGVQRYGMLPTNEYICRLSANLIPSGGWNCKIENGKRKFIPWWNT